MRVHFGTSTMVLQGARCKGSGQTKGYGLHISHHPLPPGIIRHGRCLAWPFVRFMSLSLDLSSLHNICCGSASSSMSFSCCYLCVFTPLDIFFMGMIQTLVLLLPNVVDLLLGERSSEMYSEMYMWDCIWKQSISNCICIQLMPIMPLKITRKFAVTYLKENFTFKYTVPNWTLYHWTVNSYNICNVS
jgi:hypothetical protein